MGIAQWPRSERPRERLLSRGASALSDAELLALIVRTGIAGKSALDIARDAIARFGGIAGLLAASAAELSAVRGFGPARSAVLASVVELARRSLAEEAAACDALVSPQAVRDYSRWADVRMKWSSDCSSTARTVSSRRRSSFAEPWHKPASIRAKSSRQRLRAMRRR
jgi:DNA repair protein RadC